MKRASEDGFALITTLWLVALLAVVAVIVEGWITTALDRAAALKARVANEQALIDATDRAILGMVTAGFGPRGLEPPPPAAEPGVGQTDIGQTDVVPARQTPFIALDGRTYRIGDVVIRLQDEGGLYDLSNSSRDSLARLLDAYGVSTPDSETMAVELGQYQATHPDPQTAMRREADYGAAGLPAPRHSRLISPWEPYRILDWPHSAALWHGAPAFADMVTAGPVGGLGINTAPAPVLAALAGIDPAAAARLVAARQAAPITVNDLLKSGSKITQSEDHPAEILPSNIIRLRLRIAGDPLARIVSIRLTPGEAAPYRLDFSVDRPLSALDRDTESATTPALPIFSHR
jgi:DNA uptake protein ComE-like DNA-binding protein